MAEIVLNVEVREKTGTGGARDSRRAGMVPGVLYGGAKDPVAIAVKSNEFRKALHTGKLLGHLVTLKYGDETQPVIAKAIDMHPVTDEPWHFDLYRVNADQQIKIEVPVHFANQEASPGLKRGGTLGIILHTVTVACHADSIPEEIVIDLTGLDIGDAVRISDLKLPPKVEAAMDGDVVVASVSMSKAGTEAAEGDAAAEGGEA
ncbi:50S ribosomal protein L25/general stress protein Ctc [Phenylobacterium sp.]|uniref:50S ribosomal protein L25/general stress protein Ctc n=1 Tax=Phenylobacterium sp. TaxID=1871053 RepID=UPI0025CE5FA3|nr:50S ribosomal protein L25/general stress protein Ctc [Phenylobacterium sp.]